LQLPTLNVFSPRRHCYTDSFTEILNDLVSHCTSALFTQICRMEHWRMFGVVLL